MYSCVQVWFSCTHTSTEYLLECRFWCSWSGVRPRFCKHPNNVTVAGPQSTLWIARVEGKNWWKNQIVKFSSYPKWLWIMGSEVIEMFWVKSSEKFQEPDGIAFFSMHMAYCEFGEKVIFRFGRTRRERALIGTVSDAMGWNCKANGYMVREIRTHRADSEDSGEYPGRLGLGQRQLEQPRWSNTPHLAGPEGEMEHRASWYRVS